MKIVVYEHVSGGGYAGQPIQPGILAEGFGMLRTVACDLKAAGHEVTVLLDARISKLNPPLNVDCIVPIVTKNEPKKLLPAITEINDATYVIAPETAQTLQSMVQLMEQTGKISLNCQSDGIQKVSDKTVLYSALAKNGVSTPETLTFNINDDLAKIEIAIKNKFCYPIVFKPTDGVSCSGLSVVMSDGQVGRAIQRIKVFSINQKVHCAKIYRWPSCKREFACGRRRSPGT